MIRRATHLLWCGCLFAVACSTKSGRSTGDSDGNGDAGNTTPILDCQDPRASTEPICATSLAQTPVIWSSPLALCHIWDGATDLTSEQARQVRLVLSDTARFTALTRGALGQAALVDARVEQSPFSDAQWPVATSAVSILAYELSGPTGNTTLHAELEHDLGDGGTLLEAINLTRASNDSSPLTYDPELSEVTFTYWKAGATSPEDAISLRSCAGGTDLYGAAQVLYGHASGGDDITLVRFLRTNDTGGSNSHLFFFDSIRMMRSDLSYRVFEAAGYWANVYAADEGNVPENGWLDFTRDLSTYQIVFGPLAAGDDLFGTANKSAHFRNIGGIGTQHVTLTTIDLSTAREDSLRFDTTTSWTWVDETHLRREFLDGVCPEGDVFALGDLDTYWGTMSWTVQAVTCPRLASPGFDLLALVPVAFQHDMAQVGVRFSGGAITEINESGEDGFRTAVGTSTVDLRKVNDTYLRLVIRDDTGTTVQSQTSTPGELVGTTLSDRTIQAEDPTGSVSMTLARRTVGAGVGDSAIFAPVSFELFFGGETHRVTAWDRLHYTNTHHNWNDALTAETDTLRLYWRVEMKVGEGVLTHYVRAETSDGTEVLTETEMTPLD